MNKQADKTCIRKERPKQSIIGFKLKTKNEKDCTETSWRYTKVHSYTHYGKRWTYTHTGP
jgi:hypothetical protein